MKDNDKALKIVLRVVGVIFIVGLTPLFLFLPEAFMWEPRQAEYEQMIAITMAVLGVYLLKASGNPAQHRSLISFAGWMSLLHGVLMFAQAMADTTELPNLFGDIPALILIGVVLIMLNRRSARAAAAPGAAA